ncbi:hypothetical protein ACFL59_14950 [Planctomycetota bacterium]
MRNALLTLLLLLLLTAAPSCISYRVSTFPGWRWSGFENPRPPVACSVGVLPPLDRRGPTVENGSLSRAFLPFVASATRTILIPEKLVADARGAAYGFSPNAHLQDAIVDELTANGVFESVVKIGADTQQAAPCDLRLEPELLATRVSLTQRTYGLSILAPLAYLFGAPNGKYEVEVSLRTTLRNRKGRVVWRHTFTEAATIHDGLYYGRRVDLVRDVVSLLRKGLSETQLRIAGSERVRAHARTST